MIPPTKKNSLQKPGIVFLALFHGKSILPKVLETKLGLKFNPILQGCAISTTQNWFCAGLEVWFTCAITLTLISLRPLWHIFCPTGKWNSAIPFLSDNIRLWVGSPSGTFPWCPSTKQLCHLLAFRLPNNQLKEQIVTLLRWSNSACASLVWFNVL